MNTTIEAFDTIGKVREEVAGEGAPSFILSVDELTSKDNVAFTETYDQQAWFVRFTHVGAEARALSLELENKLTYIECAVASDIKTGAADAKRALWADPYYLATVVAHQACEQKKKLLDGYIEIVRHNIALMSRMVAIRGQEVELARLEGGVARRGRK